jgi:hypothetical protein
LTLAQVLSLANILLLTLEQDKFWAWIFSRSFRFLKLETVLKSLGGKIMHELGIMPKIAIDISLDQALESASRPYVTPDPGRLSEGPINPFFSRNASKIADFPAGPDCRHHNLILLRSYIFI